MEIQNDEWHAIEQPHEPDVPKDEIVFKLIPKEGGKEFHENAILIKYRKLRCLAAIIVEIVRDVELG